MGSDWLHQADYYRAMAQVEKQLDLQPGAELPTTPGHLLAMVDALQAGTLNDSQHQMLQSPPASHYHLDHFLIGPERKKLFVC